MTAVPSPSPSPVGAGEAQRAARAELRRAGYDHGSGGRSWTSRVEDWIGRHLGSLLGGAGGSHALLLLLVLALVVAVTFAVRAGVPTRTRRGVDGEDADPLAARAAADHRRIAVDLTRQGRHAEALREWLRAAVQAIEERGVLPPRPGRTGAATAREAGPLLPAAADDLAAAMRAFDEVWFGGRAATGADAALGRAAADRVASSRIVRTSSIPDGMAAPW